MTKETDPKEAEGQAEEAVIGRAFGAGNRARLLKRYFSESELVTPENSWKHIYRLLLWIDRTIGLAHCYESDKSQPGRPWYERSLRFHGWIASELGAAPAALADEIDWLFREASRDLAATVQAEIAERRRLAAVQRESFPAFPEPGQYPELVAMMMEEMAPWFRETPPPEALQRLAERIHDHTRAENKRKNLVGEGFEDVLAAIIVRVPNTTISKTMKRPALHTAPGFNKPRKGEKTKKVDLVILSGADEHRTLVTAKWSIRADREEQFASDFEIYARLEKDGRPFDYTVVTNEFDPARLVAACDRQREGHPLFNAVVHVNPQGPMAAYGKERDRSRAIAAERVEQGRLLSFEQWLRQFAAPGGAGSAQGPHPGKR